MHRGWFAGGWRQAIGWTVRGFRHANAGEGHQLIRLQDWQTPTA
jgi:hypothetical protein